MTDLLLLDTLRDAARPLTGSPEDYDVLLDDIGDAPLVLLGEASHGTHEFYRERAEITKRLIQEKGFTLVAVEADWPDAYRINRYVRGERPDNDATEALGGFKRFPSWMWRNADVLDFVGWLRSYNDGQKPSERVGFYGLDLYSLHASIEAVLLYLDKVDPEAAQRARHRYACFEHFGEDPQSYGYAAEFGLSESCESEVIAQLIELRAQAAEYAHRDGRIAADDFFYAEQNAQIIRNAEKYYRTMFRGRVSSWNLRDQHMVETLNALLQYFGGQSRAPKAVVWAHNSHLGDARATRMGAEGEWNVGQLTRERYGKDCYLVGFTTHTGTVTAASDWGGPAERKRVVPSMEGSVENLFHQTAATISSHDFLLTLRSSTRISRALREQMYERAIGVIYRPETEFVSHYFPARVAGQFDAVLHFDQTRAVEPLERTSAWGAGEPAETYPSGM